MKIDDHRISLLLKADADEIGRMAILPTAHAILWKSKVRATRKRRQRVVALIAFTEIIGASALVLVFVRMLWTTLLNAPVSAHAFTVVVAGVLTMVAIGVIATALYVARGSKSQYSGRSSMHIVG
jgi:hypothetical protein